MMNPVIPAGKPESRPVSDMLRQRCTGHGAAAGLDDRQDQQAALLQAPLALLKGRGAEGEMRLGQGAQVGGEGGLVFFDGED